MPNRSGFTLVEFAVFTVLLAIALGATHAVLLSQQRSYHSRIRIAEARDAGRIAIQVLTEELLGASAEAGDLYALGHDSVALRAVRGFGVVCGTAGSSVRLWLTSGFFGDSETDSLLAYVEEGGARVWGGSWRAVPIIAVRRHGLPPCAHGHAAELELTVAGSLEGLAVGAPVQSFRPAVYRLYASDAGGWWLGQRLGTGPIQPVVGPFAPPSSKGLAFVFRNASGFPTDDPRTVRQVAISVRPRRRRFTDLEAGFDSFSALITLRNPWPVKGEADRGSAGLR